MAAKRGLGKGLDTLIPAGEGKSTNKKSRRNLTSFQTEIDVSQKGRQVTSAKEKEDTLAIQQ